MKRPQVFVCLVGVVSALSFDSECLSANPGKDPPPYRLLRYDEDYSFLADPSKRVDLWDSLKYIPLGKAGFLSLGGEARLRLESYDNEFFQTSPLAPRLPFTQSVHNTYLLQRYLFHADYHPTEWLRIFGQLQSSLESGGDGGPRPTDKDTIDLHQLFVDLVGHIDGDNQLTLRTGRQEIVYGSGRLIAPREGPNNRRAFDAVRLLYKQPAVSIDAFFSSPVEIDTEGFDDQNIRDTWFWGVYATTPIHALPGMLLDFYYLGLDTSQVRFNQGVGSETCHTVGTRFFGILGHWDFNDEIMYQFGQFGSGEVNAWTVATEHGYTLRNLWGQPRLGLRVAVASGDNNPADKDLQTFNPLFFRGDYFTEAGLLSPQNFIDVFPSLRFTLSKRWIAELACDVHWRENRGDGIYGPGGPLFRPNPDFGNFSRFVGTELYLDTAWQVTRHLTLSAAYSHFFAGEFIHQAGGKDASFIGLWSTFRF